MHPDGELLDGLRYRQRKVALPRNQSRELLELPLAREMVVEEEIGRLLKRAVLGQLLDGDAGLEVGNVAGDLGVERGGGEQGVNEAVVLSRSKGQFR